MMFRIFKDISDKELFEMYKDIVGSKELGLRPRTLDAYSNNIKDQCKFEMLSQAVNFTEELFYEEIALRYFNEMK